MLFPYRSSYSLVEYKMPLCTTTKHYMTKQRIGGFHTNISNLSNKEIASVIQCNVNDIVKDRLSKKLHCDFSQMQFLNDKIDYISLFKKH